jgi:hypothetical protein
LCNAISAAIVSGELVGYETDGCGGAVGLVELVIAITGFFVLGTVVLVIVAIGWVVVLAVVLVVVVVAAVDANGTGPAIVVTSSSK